MQLEDRKRRIDDAGNVPAGHRDYWTPKRAAWCFVLVGLVAGPITLLGTITIVVMVYLFATGGPSAVL